MSTTPAITKPLSRKQLSELQIEVLQILYKFRFATADLISLYQEQTTRNSNVRLKNLLDQGFIGRNYDNSQRMKQLKATYYLLPDGIKFLKTNPDLDKKGLHLSYNSRRVSPDFINHCLRIFRIYLNMDSLFTSRLEFFTSAELADQEQFPKLSPDAFLSIRSKDSSTYEFMLDLLDSSTSLSRHRQKVMRYIYHKQISKWPNKYPTVLLVCDNAGLEREIQNYIARSLNYISKSAPTYYTTTIRAIYSSKNSRDTIWTNVLYPEKTLHLLK